MTTELGPLSPELALVDPELAERARYALRLAAAVPQIPPLEARMDAQPAQRPARRHRILVRAAAALAVPSIILNAAVLRPEAPFELRTTGPVGGVAAASTTLVDTAPPPDRVAGHRAAASSAAEPSRAVAVHRVLRWKKLPAARMYDVVIWRDGRRVRDVWTREGSVSVRSIACGTSTRLAKGEYLWFVYPVESPVGTKRFGNLAHWGRFQVDDRACRHG